MMSQHVEIPVGLIGLLAKSIGVLMTEKAQVVLMFFHAREPTFPFTILTSLLRFRDDDFHLPTASHIRRGNQAL